MQSLQEREVRQNQLTTTNFIMVLRKCNILGCILPGILERFVPAGYKSVFNTMRQERESRRSCSMIEHEAIALKDRRAASRGKRADRL